MSLASDLLRELEAAGAARPQDVARYVAVLERIIRAADTDPTITEVIYVDDLRLELSEQYQKLGRYDDALAVIDALIAAGLKMHPDSRCLRAEALMRAGRIGDAEPIWAAVLADTPDDVWLYNTAGLEYGHANQHEVALDWLTDGLRLALRTGDPERLAAQLTDLRQASLDHLGRPADELQEQATDFLRNPKKARVAPIASTPAPPRDHRAVSAVALAWFPAGDYERALTLWPDFAGSELANGPNGHLPHDRYCREMQRKLVGYAEQGASGLAVAPVRVGPFTDWCAEHNRDSDSSNTRAAYAAHLAAEGDPGIVRFPPGRNEPCWCGSGRKYKKCCAAPSTAVTGRS